MANEKFPPRRNPTRKSPRAKDKFPERASFEVRGIFDTEAYLRQFTRLNNLTETPFKIGKREVVA